jgi:hypothetical protein
MSKKAKSRQQEKRKKAKALRKLINKQVYEERKRLGQNTKSTRAQTFNKKNKKKSMVKHSVANCGNVGCKRCDPGRIHHK